MSTLIVYCHPYEQSFCHAMLDALCERYDREGTPYQVIDLHADGFDPVLSRDELAVYGEGAALDSLVTRYQELIAGADRLVFIFPIWWNDMPAMLKGWLDKVLLQGFSWEPTGAGLKGTLTYITSAEVYTASSNPTCASKPVTPSSACSSKARCGSSVFRAVPGRTSVVWMSQRKRSARRFCGGWQGRTSDPACGGWPGRAHNRRPAGFFGGFPGSVYLVLYDLRRSTLATAQKLKNSSLPGRHSIC